MTTALFIFAHPDDEAYGPAGTIAKIAQNHQVVVVSLCQGNRPGSEDVSEDRIKTFNKSCKLLGATPVILDFSDCRLEYASTLEAIELLIREHNPEVVYTHSVADVHKDHRLVAECCLVACRPTINSNVRSLISCEMPSSTPWAFGQITPSFNPTLYTDVSEFIDLKRKVLELYHTEVYPAPDARSVESMESLAKQRGFQIGTDYAEAAQLVFFHDRNIQ